MFPVVWATRVPILEGPQLHTTMESIVYAWLVAVQSNEIVMP